jgi:hypothetical protein
MTFGILKVLDLTMGIRVNDEDEIAGLDVSQHGERAYIFGGGGPVLGIAEAIPMHTDASGRMVGSDEVVHQGAGSAR